MQASTKETVVTEENENFVWLKESGLTQLVGFFLIG